MAKKKNIPSQHSVGPSTENLKGRFRAHSIPLETDFAALIDVADCGRKAVGLSPDFTPATDTGLMLDTNSQLKVQPDANSGIKVDTFGIGLVPEQLFVSGMIMMFSGPAAPAGWAFCDGQGGRPDLRNKFIMGGSGNDVSQSGGVAISGSGTSKTYSADTSSNGQQININTSSVILEVSHLPQHRHWSGIWSVAWDDDGGSGGMYYTSDTEVEGGWHMGADIIGADDGAVKGYTDWVGGGQGHSHSVSTTDHSHTITSLPAYYILAFIIKL